MDREETSTQIVPVVGQDRSAEARLVEQVRRGDAAASHRFFHEYYPGIYRYLLWLAERPEVAEDLAQETFVRAWRHLDQFDDRGPLRAWLHRIAHREFLRSLRRQRASASLEEVGEVAGPDGAEWAETVELRAVLRKLPVAEGEIVVLHYLEGYNCEEIAQIVRAPVGTVKYRLSTARAHLQRELGEGDLLYLNEQPAMMRRWAWLPLDQMYALETRLARGGVRSSDPAIPNTEDRTPNTESGATEEESMERREFLRQAAVGAAGLMLPETEKEIVDSRLTQKVALAFKGMALADLCEHMRGESGVHLAAGPSVADEKVTVFCEKQPLRDVMRQLSRPFGYTWLRSGKAGHYRYELVQDLRGQLLEEELRNRERNTALLALEREIERYRPYLDLSPDEALARAQERSDAGGAPPEEKQLLEHLAGLGWGPMQMYFRLSPQDQAALRAGQMLTFSPEPRPGERQLPPDVAHGVLQSFRDRRVVKLEDGFGFVPVEPGAPEGLPTTAVPEVRGLVTLWISQSEPGQFIIDGYSGAFSPMDRPKAFFTTFSGGPYAVGRSGAVLTPDNARANAKLARDPELRGRVTIEPRGNLSPSPSPERGGVPISATGVVLPSPSRGQEGRREARAADDARGGGEVSPEAKATSAEVLEALHQAAGMPIIADYYTRLFPAASVSAPDRPLFETLNQVADAMRLRWQKEEGWLQFRSATFYDDRTKEVPNRLLARWSASRREHGCLTLDDLCEIAQLSDAQLDGAEMAEGAKEIWGLGEWDLARNSGMRPHMRFLAELTPAQRQEAASGLGLAFSKMSLAQQQKFLSFALPSKNEPLQSYLVASEGGPFQMEELKEAALRVDYTQPGWFQWGNPAMSQHWVQWVVPVEPGPRGRRVLRPPVRERTREAALQAVRRLDLRVREAALDALPELVPSGQTARVVPLEEQIFPTELGLTIVYITGAANSRPVRTLHGGLNSWQISW